MRPAAECGRARTRNRYRNLRMPTRPSHLCAARNGSARQFVLIQSPTDIVRTRWKQISISKPAASREVSSAAHRFRREHSREMESPNNPSTAPEPAVPFEVVAVDYCHQGSLVVFLHVSNNQVPRLQPLLPKSHRSFSRSVRVKWTRINTVKSS